MRHKSNDARGQVEGIVARWISASFLTDRQLARGAFPVFQLDATAYPGNSGSPLYDPQTAEVIGVVNMVFVKGSKEAALSQPSGITYANPAVHVQALLQTIR